MLDGRCGSRKIFRRPSWIANSMADHFNNHLKILSYICYQKFIFPVRKKKEYLRKYLGNHSDSSILDLGCGPGIFRDLLECKSYCGVDMDITAIKYARCKFRKSTNSLFLNYRVEELDQSEQIRGIKFDVILAHGLIHHLNDSQVCSLFRIVRHFLASDGRFISFDPCFTAKQALVSKKLMLADQGKYIRSIAGYKELFASSELKFTSHIERDYLIVPYELITFTSTK